MRGKRDSWRTRYRGDISEERSGPEQRERAGAAHIFRRQTRSLLLRTRARRQERRQTGAQAQAHTQTKGQGGGHRLEGREAILVQSACLARDSFRSAPPTHIQAYFTTYSCILDYTHSCILYYTYS